MPAPPTRQPPALPRGVWPARTSRASPGGRRADDLQRNTTLPSRLRSLRDPHSEPQRRLTRLANPCIFAALGRSVNVLTGSRTPPCPAAPPERLDRITPEARTLVALGTVIGLVACGPKGPSRTLEYYFTYDPRSLDPAFSTDVPTGEVDALLFDNLTQFDVDGRLAPGLATVLGSRPHRVALHLPPPHRRDASTTAGRSAPPMSRPPISAPSRPGRSADAPGLSTPSRAPGPSTRARPPASPGSSSPTIRPSSSPSRSRSTSFPSWWRCRPPASCPRQPGDDFDQSPIGSGPWRFVSWSHDDYIVLARNPAYWGAVPLADSMRIRIIPEPLTQAAEYERGGLSVVEIPFGETRRWEERHGARARSGGPRSAISTSRSTPPAAR